MKPEKQVRLFRENIRKSFRKAPFFVAGDPTAAHFKNKKIQTLNAVELEFLESALSLLKQNSSLRISEFAIPALRGYYYQDVSGCSGMIFSLTQQSIPTAPQSLNITMYSSFMSEMQKSTDPHVTWLLNDLNNFHYGFFKVYHELLRHMLGLSYRAFNRLLYKNSFSQYLSFLTFFKSHPTDIMSILSEEKYNHIKIFTYLYHWIVHVLLDVLKDAKPALSLHDFGSELAFLPAILSSLSAQGGLDIAFKRIYASDFAYPKKVRFFNYDQVIHEIAQHKIRFIASDLTDGSRRLPICDISTAIDVIEHLPSEEAALRAVKRIWEHTTRIMFVHVPFEKEETKWHDHNMVFDQAKLRQWASAFPDAVFLSDAYHEKEHTTLCDLGFFILKRTSP